MSVRLGILLLTRLTKLELEPPYVLSIRRPPVRYNSRYQKQGTTLTVQNVSPYCKKKDFQGDNRLTSCLSSPDSHPPPPPSPSVTPGVWSPTPLPLAAWPASQQLPDSTTLYRDFTGDPIPPSLQSRPGPKTTTPRSKNRPPPKRLPDNDRKW